MHHKVLVTEILLKWNRYSGSAAISSTLQPQKIPYVPRFLMSREWKVFLLILPFLSGIMQIHYLQKKSEVSCASFVYYPIFIKFDQNVGFIQSINHIPTVTKVGNYLLHILLHFLCKVWTLYIGPKRNTPAESDLFATH